MNLSGPRSLLKISEKMANYISHGDTAMAESGYTGTRYECVNKYLHVVEKTLKGHYITA